MEQLTLLIKKTPMLNCLPRDGDAQVVIDAEKLLLRRGELGLRALQRRHDDELRRAQAQADGSLFDGFHRVFDLVDAALRRPQLHIRVVLVAVHPAREVRRTEVEGTAAHSSLNTVGGKSRLAAEPSSGCRTDFSIYIEMPARTGDSFAHSLWLASGTGDLEPA